MESRLQVHWGVARCSVFSSTVTWLSMTFTLTFLRLRRTCTGIGNSSPCRTPSPWLRMCERLIRRLDLLRLLRKYIHSSSSLIFSFTRLLHVFGRRQILCCMRMRCHVSSCTFTFQSTGRKERFRVRTCQVSENCTLADFDTVSDKTIGLFQNTRWS